MKTSLLWLCCLLAVGGCIEAAQPPARGRPAAAEPAASNAAAKAPAPAAKPSFVEASGGTAEDVVRGAVEAASQDGTKLVVYVGATWCEPCQDFHRALEAGQLDEALAGVRFLEFDADRDAERLAAAGYDGRLIPRFALPGEDGRFGGTKIEGGIKGAGSVEHIMRRLAPMLASASR